MRIWDSNVPEEVIKIIALEARIQDSVALALTCKEAYDLIHHMSALWKDYAQRIPGPRLYTLPTPQQNEDQRTFSERTVSSYKNLIKLLARPFTRIIPYLDPEYPIIISGNGLTIVGTSTSGTKHRACIAFFKDGQLGIGTLPVTHPDKNTYAHAVDYYGLNILGTNKDPDGSEENFMILNKNIKHSLPGTPDSSAILGSHKALSIHSDEKQTKVVIVICTSELLPRVFLKTFTNTGPSQLTYLGQMTFPSHCTRSYHDLSTNNTTIVGTRTDLKTPFIWTNTKGMDSLSNHYPDMVPSTGIDASYDGATVVGTFKQIQDQKSTTESFLWARGSPNDIKFSNLHSVLFLGGLEGSLHTYAQAVSGDFCSMIGYCLDGQNKKTGFLRQRQLELIPFILDNNDIFEQAHSINFDGTAMIFSVTSEKHKTKVVFYQYLPDHRAIEAQGLRVVN